ncbi:MAG TPA: sulfur carrier protein ThiS [Candidatus Dormibacteraeota bacterium]
MTVAIVLNGEPAEVEAGITLAAFLENLGIDRRRVVVEHNRRVLRGAELEAATVARGDELEVLQLVGGGA